MYLSVYVVDYCSWVATIIFLIPPGKITYVNTIFTLISISFALSSASSLITLTVASYALKLDNPASSSSSSISFTCRLCLYLPDDVWVSGKIRDITVDSYVESVSDLALWPDLQMLTSVFKSLFGLLMLSMSCLTLSSSNRGKLQLFKKLYVCFILVTNLSKDKVVSFL